VRRRPDTVVTDCRRSGDAAFDALVVAILEQLPAVGARAGEPGVRVALRARDAEGNIHFLGVLPGGVRARPLKEQCR